MKLSKEKRLEYIFQLRILEGLYPDEADSYRIQRKAFEQGFSLHYEEVLNSLYEEMPVEECREILDILSMYRAINDSYEQLNDKSKVSESKVKFHGFDGNNESHKMAYVYYFIEELGRFKEISERSNGYYNSHSPMTNKYERMLKVWRATDTGDSYTMSLDQLLTLVDA